MIWHEVQDYFDAATMGGFQQPVKIRHGPEDRMDGPVIGNVIAEVRHRRRIDRRYPYGIDSEPMEIVQLGDDAGQVADPVTVTVGKGTGIDLINDGSLPPLDGGACLVHLVHVDSWNLMIRRFDHLLSEESDDLPIQIFSTRYHPYPYEGISRRCGSSCDRESLRRIGTRAVLGSRSK